MLNKQWLDFKVTPKMYVRTCHKDRGKGQTWLGETEKLENW